MSNLDDLRAKGLWPIRRGMTDAQFNDGIIASVQDVLNAGGANPQIASDGVFGSKTENAMRQYQRDNGLPVTGQYDDATYANFQGVPGPVAGAATSNGLLIAGGVASAAALVAGGVAAVHSHKRH
jgi:peptidoglycan hydrolase-like protein with peptidoglycan-binding domain